MSEFGCYPDAIRVSEGVQIPLLDQDNPAAQPIKSRCHKVDKLLAKIRTIHEELNSQLYTHPTERPAIHSPKDIWEILHPMMALLDHEELWVLNLDSRNRISCIKVLYKGSVNSSQVRVAEIFRQAVIDNIVSIVLAHNHPSGDPTPSPDDISLTHAVVEAGRLLDIEVLDHLIIVGGQFVSLAERNLGNLRPKPGNVVDIGGK